MTKAKQIVRQLPKQFIDSVELDKKEIRKREEKIELMRMKADEVKERTREMSEEQTLFKKDIILKNGKILQKDKTVVNTEITQILAQAFKGYISRGFLYRIVAEHDANIEKPFLWTRDFNTESPTWQKYVDSKTGVNTTVNNSHLDENYAQKGDYQVSDEEQQRRDTTSREESQIAMEHRIRITKIQELITMLTGLDYSARAALHSETPRGQSARMYLMEQTKSYRFKLAKSLDTHTQSLYVSEMQELYFVLKDALEQFQNELKISGEKTKAYGV